MTDEALRQALEDSISETLDAMFFTSCLGPAEDRAVADLEAAARVTFQGKPSGRLTVRMAGGAARAIAAGFLGEDEETVPEERVGDVLRELTNMICGFVLSRVECAEEFRLDEPKLVDAASCGIAPEQASEPPAAPGAPRRRMVHAVETGAGALEASLEMEGRICPP
ncbi:MAG TPA: chemotaxis protein CheX [Bryobacteraceae bacterium]|nr:chemotaxis protein CheX [Bryobacteraceae bacterium]